MKQTLIAVAAALVAIPAAAQQPPAQPPSQQAPAPVVRDLASGMQAQWAGIRRNLAASIDKMSDADYAFRPQGASAEVRSYGALLVHLANANNAFCGRAAGETGRPQFDEKTTTSKAEIAKALNDALTYCDAVYEKQTVASLTEMVKSQGRGGVTNEIARGLGLFSNIAHNNEHYGNLVTYMRAKGIVPPSSER